MENIEEITRKHGHIKGWGIDADPRNEPTYPMKNYTGDDHRRLNYKRPFQQTTDIEVLHSNERPSLSAVFGTSSPPSGLSGVIRRFAFRFSESTYTHWLSLLLADRINSIEGIIDDLSHGYVPNIFAERGWAAEWKFNRRNFVVKSLGGLLAVSSVFIFMFNKNKLKVA